MTDVFLLLVKEAITINSRYSRIWCNWQWRQTAGYGRRRSTRFAGPAERMFSN